MGDNTAIDNYVYLAFGCITRKMMSSKPDSCYRRRFFKWRKDDPLFSTGLILSSEDEPDERVPYYLEEKIQGTDNPMCWGYAMRLFLRKEISQYGNSIIKVLDDYSESKKPFSINLVEPKKFISRIPNNRFDNYKEIYDKIISENKVNDKAKCNDDKAEQFLNQAAYNFCVKYVWISRSQQRKGVKWSADPLKIEYYRSKWKKITENDEDKNEKALFFDVLIKEMEDADSKAASHLKKRDKQQKQAFILPILSAVLSSIVASTNSMFSDFFDSGNSAVKWVKIGLIIISFLTAGATAWILAIKGKGKEDEEVWLRQRLLYFNLGKEIEAFFNESDPYNDKIPDKKITIFMQNISQIRQKDWHNFFTNMNCRNYEK